jgi:hypothetical protein
MMAMVNLQLASVIKLFGDVSEILVDVLGFG